jgi:DNA-binding MarR family transcriptional regulator
MIVDVTRTIAPATPETSDRHRVRVETIIADFHDTLFALKCATSERLLRLGVSMAQLNILYILRRSDEMPMSRLAEVLNVSLSNATGLIDRMEERGFIERTRVPADRRIVLVRLTAEGVRLLEEQDAMSEDLMRRVLDKLGPNQLSVVAQATADLRAAAEATLGPLPDRYPASTTTPRSPLTLRGADPAQSTDRRD